MLLQELRTLIKHLGMIDEDMRRLYAEKATNSMSAQAVVRTAIVLWVGLFSSHCRGARTAACESSHCHGARTATCESLELKVTRVVMARYACECSFEWVPMC
jgi:hypothetical protein